MNRVVQYQSFFEPPQRIVSTTPQGFSSFFDRGPQPATAALHPFSFFQPQGPIGQTPHGLVGFFDCGPAPATAARQSFAFFQPQGRIVSLTPQGFVAFFDRGPQPPTAALQPFEGYRATIAFPPPRGSVAFFDRGPQPATAALQPFSFFTARGHIVSITPQGFTAFFDRGPQPASAARMPFPAEWKFIQSPFVPVIGVAGIAIAGTLTARIGALPLGCFGKGAAGFVTFDIRNAGGYSLYHGPERDQGPRPLVRRRVAKQQTLPPHAKPAGSIEKPLALPPFATASGASTASGPPRLPQMGRHPVDFSDLAPRNPIQLGAKIKDAQDESADLAAIRLLIELGLR